jgi:CzcA family heavy metal efflux pump
MLNRIVQFSLRFRGVVVALACVFVAYGIYVAAHAKLDVLPDFVPPEVTVETEAPGLTPEQVEILVTRPIENSINGLGDMSALRSESISGLSTITAIFKEGTDIRFARQMLNERLTEISGELPAGVKTPVMSALMSSTMDLLKIGLVSTNLTPMQLRTFADWTVKPRLLAVPGVAHCIVFGGEVKQLQIQVQPDRLMAYGLSISDVLDAAQKSTAVMGAGYVENANQRILIQTEGEAVTPEELGEVALTHTNGQTIRLKDVANVKEAGAPKFGDTLIQGQHGIFMATASQYGANTMEATKAVEATLKDMQPLFDREGIVLYPGLHRPATFIENSLHNIFHSLIMGGILVAVVLLLFLGHVRAALISITAIPLSLLAAIVLMDKAGYTLNTITLGGLAIAIGAVVDDAIIDVENIFRRLRENEAKGRPRPAFRVVLDASIEVRSAVVYATFIVALIFLPVLAMTGLQGSFFSPLALSYILAIMASLGVALTITPALVLLSYRTGSHDSDEPRLQKWLKKIYTGVLEFVSLWPKAVLGAVILVCVAALLVLPKPGSDLLPEFREGHFVLQVQAIPGTSLPEMIRIGGEITHQLLEETNIATVEQQAGRAEQGEDTWEPNRCEFHVELKPDVPGEEQEKLMNRIRHILDHFPGIQSEVVTFLGDRISETITGESAPVVISIYGNDLDVLDDKANEIAQVLNNKSLVQGAADVQIQALPGAPRLAVKLRPERLTQFGFRPVEVLEAVQTAYAGETVAQVHEGDTDSDVTVILDPASRREPEQVGSLLVRNAEGLALPLKELSEVYMTTGRFSIMHDGASRRQVVTCAPEGRDVASFVEQAKKAVADNVKLPRGTYAVFSGTAEQAAAAQHELFLNSGIAAVGILILLILVTGNWRNLFLILANVPFALVGGVLAVLLTSGGGDSGLTIGSLVGFVTLFGITTRNSIMMISHFEHLVRHEGMEWGHDAAMKGASERLIPILMTALVTALGLLPLALGTGEAGREIEGPMAIVILGGLITSTALNLLVLPTLSLRYGQFKKLAENEEGAG